MMGKRGREKGEGERIDDEKMIPSITHEHMPVVLKGRHKCQTDPSHFNLLSLSFSFFFLALSLYLMHFSLLLLCTYSVTQLNSTVDTNLALLDQIVQVGATY